MVPRNSVASFPFLLFYHHSSVTNTPALLWTSLDAVGAWALVNIWRSRSNIQKSKRDLRIAAIYLLNPYIFLALSTSALETTLQLPTLMFTSRGQSSLSLPLDTRRPVAPVFTRGPLTSTGSPAPPLGSSITSS
ncbi:hypothetical protein EDB84DRAFT_1443939 [Lactarius hengduanensis]|nr:hypothetical protein EDB84DRAFT_1443939 [Lactarius hengduanensis]